MSDISACLGYFQSAWVVVVVALADNDVAGIRLWDEDAVDDMHDPVGGWDVTQDHVGLVNLGRAFWFEINGGKNKKWG